MRSQIGGDDVDGVTETAQLQSQILLCRFRELPDLAGLEAAGLGLAQNVRAAGVRVLQVRAGVATGGRHALDVEDVVLLKTGAEVGVFDRRKRHLRGGVLLGVVKQIVKVNRSAFAGLERLAVGAEHHAESGR